jgi:hypothetical protein
MDVQAIDATSMILASLRAVVAELDVGSVSPADAVGLVDWFAEVERLGAAGKVLAAGRVADAEPYLVSGDRSMADWLAKRTGSTVSEARSVLDTAQRLAQAPVTDAAFRAGELSVKQAEAISCAAAADPSSETRLLGVAGSQSLQKLRDECARVRAAAEIDPRARHERIRRSRTWRRWTDAEGARCGSYRLTPDAGALLEAAAQPFIDAAIDTDRRSGAREPFDALAADGLVAMAEASLAGGQAPLKARGGRGRRRLRNRRELICLVDLAALQRGSLEAGETCEIPGVGPIPVAVARQVFGDALLRVVIRDGVDVKTVVHTGRTANAVQETAVLARSGGRCERPRCDLVISEIDHITGYTKTKTTTLDDLAGLCGTCHDRKTRHERERPPP